MSDTTDRAAEAIEWHFTDSDEHNGCALRCGWGGQDDLSRAEHLAQALDDAGLLATPEHDEQVRADERARVSVVHSTLTDEQLVDELVRRGVLEEQRDDLFQPTRVPCDCSDGHGHAVLPGDDGPRAHTRFQVVPSVRYLTDWRLDTRTDEQRSDDAITTLRRRLTEEPTHG